MDVEDNDGVENKKKTIPLVINSDKHLIIEAETASGKTEIGEG